MRRSSKRKVAAIATSATAALILGFGPGVGTAHAFDDWGKKRNKGWERDHKGWERDHKGWERGKDRVKDKGWDWDWDNFWEKDRKKDHKDRKDHGKARNVDHRHVDKDKKDRRFDGKDRKDRKDFWDWGW